MSCENYNVESSCLASTDSCAWCSASGGCCIDGTNVNTGDACVCLGGLENTLSTIAIVGIVFGCIFWIAVCFCIYRCFQRRTIVTTQTIVVAGPNGSQVPYQQVHQGQPIMYGQQQPVQQGQPMMYGQQQPGYDMNGNNYGSMSPQNGQQPGPYGQMPPQQKVGGATF